VRTLRRGSPRVVPDGPTPASGVPSCSTTSGTLSAKPSQRPIAPATSRCTVWLRSIGATPSAATTRPSARSYDNPSARRRIGAYHGYSTSTKASPAGAGSNRLSW
jgi:hypothetical protein